MMNNQGEEVDRFESVNEVADQPGHNPVEPPESVDEPAAPNSTPATPLLNIVSTTQGHVKIGDFTGKESWRLYKTKFERVCHMNGWDNFRLEHLWIHLSGEALSFAEGLPGSAGFNYAKLCEELHKRFGEDRLAPVHKATLLTRQRKNGESLAVLGQDIRDLVTFAYPKFKGDAREEMILEKFMDAIPDAELRRAIYRTKPENLADAVENGVQIEAWGMNDEKRHGKHRLRVVEEGEDSENNECLRVVKDLQKQMKELQLKKEVTCYYCGRQGHVVRDCKTKVRDEGSQRPQKGTDRSQRPQRGIEGSQRPQMGAKMTCFRCGGRGHRAGDCATAAENE